MATIFLSYDREDQPKAKSIVAALESAGHNVWWDRHIKGGKQYSKEIEQALQDADAVVVLWSERSVESPWVRDEAAAGRDRNRLVPAMLDPTEPPLGFRQYQAVDLTRLRSGRRSAAVHELLAAIDALIEPSGKPSADEAARLPGHPRPFKRLTVVTVAAALAAVALAVLLLLRPWDSGPSATRLTVAAGENSAESRALAGNLLVQLGSLQAANADGLQLVEPGSRDEPDLTFKVSAVPGQREARASLALLDNRNDVLLWSREFFQPSGNHADLRQQLAYSAGQVLGCAVTALSPDHRKIRLPTLKLYLNGCAALSDLLSDNPETAVATFQKVVQQAPGFEGAWAKLLLAEIQAYQRTGLSDPKLRAALRAHVTAARKLNPTMAEAYLAEGWLQPPRPILGWMRLGDEAVARHPNHSDALETHSQGLVHVGRMREAADQARQAVRMAPLSPSARETLIQRLLDFGAVEAARKELREAERLWPGASSLLDESFALEYRFGDPQEARRLALSGILPFRVSEAQMSFLAARIDPSPAKIETAILDARASLRHGGGPMFGNYVQTLAAFDRREELVAALLSFDPELAPGVISVLFRPVFSPLHKDRRFMRIADRFGLVEYWQESGRWPDFCTRADLPFDCKQEAERLSIPRSAAQRHG